MKLSPTKSYLTGPLLFVADILASLFTALAEGSEMLIAILQVRALYGKPRVTGGGA